MKMDAFKIVLNKFKWLFTFHTFSVDTYKVFSQDIQLKHAFDKLFCDW